MSAQIFPLWSDRLKRYDVNRRNLSPGAEELASWLSDDVGSKNAVRAFVERLESAERSSFGGYLGSGNAHHVRVANGFVFIENQFVDEQKVLIAIDGAIALLRAYELFLDEAKRGREQPPEAISVQFELEGAPAMDFYLATGFPLGLTQHS